MFNCTWIVWVVKLFFCLFFPGWAWGLRVSNFIQFAYNVGFNNCKLAQWFSNSFTSRTPNVTQIRQQTPIWWDFFDVLLQKVYEIQDVVLLLDGTIMKINYSPFARDLWKPSKDPCVSWTPLWKPLQHTPYTVMGVSLQLLTHFAVNPRSVNNTEGDQ